MSAESVVGGIPGNATQASGTQATGTQVAATALGVEAPSGPTGTFAVADSVELAAVERSGFVESRHAGAAVVIGADGEVIRALGDVTSPMFPRSAMKPFQAVAVMASGVTLRGEDAAIATASHSGSPHHVALVRGILARADLPESALGCPPAWPIDPASRAEARRPGKDRSPVYMECSGKHAAMLVACAQNNWSTADYLEPEHPLQKRILDVLERFTGERAVASGVDGCGTPVHAISLAGLGRGIARIATSKPSSPFAIYREAGELADAVRHNGWVVAGRGLPDTVVIDHLKIFAKGGAEGVMVASAANGTTVAVKILDGSRRAATVVALSLLADAGAVQRSEVDAILPELRLGISGGGRQVGVIRPSYV